MPSKNTCLLLQDGLFLITKEPELVIGYPFAILTPNVTEHKRLVAKILGEKNNEASGNWREVSDEDLPGQLQALAKKYFGVFFSTFFPHPLS
jgi:ATP-dependent NAD(P)H-hydrate dehydratase